MKEKMAVSLVDSDQFEESSDEDNDDKESLAYQEWKARELKRLLRDREELRVHEEEKKEVERRRNLTDVERQAENLRLGSD
jgi:microfibrillar-associated protein 1